MAKQSELEILINAQQADASLNDLNRATKLLNQQVKDLKPGTQEFVNKAKDLAQVEARMRDLTAEMRQFSSEQKKSAGFFSQLKQGIAQGIGQMAAFFSVDLIKSTASAVDEVSRKFIKLRGDIQTLTGASGAELDNLTARVAALSDKFDKDYNEVLKGANNFAQQFGISQSEALTLIEKGFIKGADAQDNFLDKISEYGVQFKNAGYSAEEFIKISTQEVKSGIYDDKLIDSIKEINLRVSELTKTQQDALKNAFGDKFTAEFTNKVKSGAITTKDALNIIRQESEKVNLSTTQMQTLIADLGGGPAEDVGGLAVVFKALGDAQNLSLEATTEYEKAQKEQLKAGQQLALVQVEIAKEYEGIAKATDQAKTGFLTLLYQGVLFLLKGFNQFKDQAVSYIQPVINSIIEFGKYIFQSSDLTEALKKILVGAFTLISSAVRSFVDTLTGVLKILGFLYENIIVLQGVWNGLVEVLVGVGKTFQNVLDIIGALFRLDFKALVSSVGNLFVDLGKTIYNVFAGVGQSLLETIVPGLYAIRKKAEDELTALENRRKSSLDKMSQIEKEQLDAQERFNQKSQRLTELLNAKNKETQQKTDLEQQEAAKKAAEAQQKIDTEYAKNKLEAEKQLQDLLLANMTEGRAKEIAIAQAEYKRKLAEIKVSEQLRKDLEIALLEAKRLEIAEINAKYDEEDLKKYTEANQRFIENAQTFFDEDLADIYNTSRELLEEQLIILEENGLMQTDMALQIANELAKINEDANEIGIKGYKAFSKEKIEIIKAEVEARKKVKQLEQKIESESLDNARTGVQLFGQIVGEKTTLGKIAAGVDAALAIGGIVRNTGIEIANYYAELTKPVLLGGLGAAGFAVATGLATQAKIRAGLSIAGIVAQTVGKFTDKKEKGGYLSGPSHAEGGMKVIGTNIEVEGGEFVVNKISTARNRALLEAINARPDVSYAQRRGKYESGGMLPNNLTNTQVADNQAVSNSMVQVELLISEVRNLIQKIDEKSESYKKVEMPLKPLSDNLKELWDTEAKNRVL